MGAKTFRSKSRVLALESIKRNKGDVFSLPTSGKREIFTSVGNNFIAWIGRSIPKDNLYGFRNIDISESDLSILVDAKLLVVAYISCLGKVESAVNFAYEYGIPILWVNSFFPSKEKAWFFDNTSKTICWELICQMAR
mgnify:CR=1 FL=1